MTDPLGIIGAGGHAKVVIAAAQAAGVEVIAVYDDAVELVGSTVLGLPVLGDVAAAEGFRGELLAAIGDGKVRERIVRAMPHAKWATVVHPHAWVDASARIGPGSVVCAGAVIQPDARIGDHVIVNTGATVDHDCVLGDYCHVGPGCHLSGSTVLETGVFMGTGSATRQGVRVGGWTLVGVGGVVVKDLPGGVVATGVPAFARRDRTRA